MLSLFIVLLIFLLLFLVTFFIFYRLFPKFETLEMISQNLNFTYYKTNIPYAIKYIGNHSILIQKNQGKCYPSVNILCQKPFAYEGNFYIKGLWKKQRQWVAKTPFSELKTLFLTKTIQSTLQNIPTSYLKGHFEVKNNTLSYMTPKTQPLKTTKDYQEVIQIGLQLTQWIENHFFDINT